MRYVDAACSVVLVLFLVPSAFAATEITTCGQVVVTGSSAFLSTDLDCTGSTADSAIKFEGSGVLDLRGFTVRNATTAVTCEGNCNVRNGSLIDNLTNVAGKRVKLKDVVIGRDQGGINHGVICTKGASLKNVTIDGAWDSAVIGNRGTIRLDTVSIAHGRHGVRTQGTIVAVDTTVTDIVRAGLKATRVKLVRSSVTGSGTDPDCNRLIGLNFFLCADVVASKKPTFRGSSCDTSMVSSSNINLADPDNWGICAGD